MNQVLKMKQSLKQQLLIVIIIKAVLLAGFLCAALGYCVAQQVLH
jgi:hypothetical protein